MIDTKSLLFNVEGGDKASSFLCDLNMEEHKAIKYEVASQYKKFNHSAKWIGAPLTLIISSLVSGYMALLVEANFSAASKDSDFYREEKSYKVAMVICVLAPLIIGGLIFYFTYRSGKKELITNENHPSFDDRRLLSLKKKIRVVEEEIKKTNNKADKAILIQSKDYFDLQLSKTANEK